MESKCAESKSVEQSYVYVGAIIMVKGQNNLHNVAQLTIKEIKEAATMKAGHEHIIKYVQNTGRFDKAEGGSRERSKCT